jgi:hypothetical protein
MKGSALNRSNREPLRLSRMIGGTRQCEGLLCGAAPERIGYVLDRSRDLRPRGAQSHYVSGACHDGGEEAVGFGPSINDRRQLVASQ